MSGILANFYKFFFIIRIILYIVFCMIQLREYQTATCDRVEDLVINGDKNVLVSLPTGAGKTVIASELVRRFTSHGKKTVFVVPRNVLIQQTIDTFSKQGFAVNVVHGKTDGHNDLTANVWVTTSHTIYRRNYFKSWAKDKIIIIDECHIGLERQSTFFASTGARIIGLTASPEQMSGRAMVKKRPNDEDDGWRFAHAVYDEYLQPCQIKDLQEQGFLAKYSITDGEGVKLKLPKDLKRRLILKGKSEVDGEEILEAIMKSGNKVKDLIKSIKRPCLIFCPLIAAAQEVLSWIGNTEYGYIDGDTKEEDRQAIFDKVQRGELKGIVNVGVLTTGFDLPIIKEIVLLRHILSKDLFVQIIGRALRPYNDETAVIHDFFGSYDNFRTEITNDGIITWLPEGHLRGETPEDEDFGERTDLAELNKQDPIKAKKEYIEYLKEMMEELLYATKDMEDAMAEYESDLTFDIYRSPEADTQLVDMAVLVSKGMFKTLNSMIKHKLGLMGYSYNAKPAIWDMDTEIIHNVTEALWRHCFGHKCDNSFNEVLRGDNKAMAGVAEEFDDRLQWWLKNYGGATQ